jgi:hypothetical protein
MQALRDRAHNLIHALTDDELDIMWAMMQTQFYDLYMLSAVQSAKENFKPGDVFSREEALALLVAPQADRSIFDQL